MHEVETVRTAPRLRVPAAALLLGLWLLLYASFTLLTPPLLDDADSVHAEVAREMLVRDDFVTLYANGIRYLEKAPVLYWSMAGAMRVFGVNAAAARLPLALAMLLLTFLMEHMARRIFRNVAEGDAVSAERAGLYAGLLTLSSFGLFLYSHLTLPDAMVCLWLALAIACYRGLDRRENLADNRSWLLCWGFAVACALNVLTKGLIGLVFPVAIVSVHLLATRGWRGGWQRLRGMHWVSSVVLFFAVAAPWHVMVGLANPTVGHPGSPHRVAATATEAAHWVVPLPTDGNVHGWTWFYFMNEHVLRYLNLRVPHDYDTLPLWLFYGLLVVWLMPWSAYLGKALGEVPWRALWPGGLAGGALRPAFDGSPRLSTLDSARLLCGIWAGMVMLFFSFSTRQEYYCLPALPPLILLIAGWLSEEDREARSFAVPNLRVVAGQRIALVLMVVGSLGGLVALYFVMRTQPPGPNVDLASLLAQNPADYALSLGHFLDLNAKAMGAFRTPLLMTAAALLGGTAVNMVLRRAYKTHDANLCLAAATVLFLLAAHVGLQIFSPVISSARLAKAIEPQVRANDIVVIHGEYEAGSTLGFYLRRADLHIFEGRSSNLWYGSFFPDSPKIFETPETLAAEWAGKRRVWMWTEQDKVPQMPGRMYVIAESGGKEIVSNHQTAMESGF